MRFAQIWLIPFELEPPSTMMLPGEIMATFEFVITFHWGSYWWACTDIKSLVFHITLRISTGALQLASRSLTSHVKWMNPLAVISLKLPLYIYIFYNPWVTCRSLSCNEEPGVEGGDAQQEADLSQCRICTIQQTRPSDEEPFERGSPFFWKSSASPTLGLCLSLKAIACFACEPFGCRPNFVSKKVFSFLSPSLYS